MFPDEYFEDIEDYESELVERYNESDLPLFQELNSYADEHFRSGSSHNRPKVFYAFAEGLGTDYSYEDLVKLGGLLQFHHEISLWLDDNHEGDRNRRNGDSYPHRVEKGPGDTRLVDTEVVKNVLIPSEELDDLDIPPIHRRKARRIMTKAVTNLAEGQAQDNLAESMENGDTADYLGIGSIFGDEEEWYLSMVDSKTGSLIGAAAAAGILAAGKDFEKAYDWSEKVGRIYQIQDDIIDNLDMDGKTIYSDLDNQKDSIVWQKAQEADETGTVEHVWRNDDNSEIMLDKAWEEARNSGIVDELLEDIRDMEEEANQILSELDWENEEYMHYLESLTAGLRQRAEAAKKPS